LLFDDISCQHTTSHSTLSNFLGQTAHFTLLAVGQAYRQALELTLRAAVAQIVQLFDIRRARGIRKLRSDVLYITPAAVRLTSRIFTLIDPQTEHLTEAVVHCIAAQLLKRGGGLFPGYVFSHVPRTSLLELMQSC
jgi:hypothetical protein